MKAQSGRPAFLFTTCQAGAEPALKQELARLWPAFRFAYSRPGFVTFKLPPGATPPEGLDLGSVFARASGLSLGRADAPQPDDRARQVWDLLRDISVEAVHVWPRDAHEPGFRDFEPGLSAASEEAAALIRQARPGAAPLPDGGGSGAAAGALAADVILIDEATWWVGYHRVHSVVSAWPGGLFPESLPAGAVSRVYLKLREALVWSGLPLVAGERVVELGCAPGGSSQALLDLGAQVIGVDPAEMHPLVLGHPRFRHIRRRSKEVRRADLVGTDWLTCDINLPPNYTLDTVEAVLSYPGARPRGVLLMLKLIDWSLASRLPEFLERVRSWGYPQTLARQLHHNRREVCVAAGDFSSRA